MSELESQLTTERTRRMSDAEEWKQFQADLLMTVRVANDFQTEAQTNLEQISTETAELKEKLKLVENENERLKLSAANNRAAATITRTPPHATQTQVLIFSHLLYIHDVIQIGVRRSEQLEDQV